jgi:hypothetical protein
MSNRKLCSSRPRCFRSCRTRSIRCNALELEDAEQELVEAGWHFSADGLIEASAFGCDSKVLERAVSRALQKAADDELDALEITRMTLQQNSGLDYVSIFARSRTIRRNPYWTPSAME